MGTWGSLAVFRGACVWRGGDLEAHELGRPVGMAHVGSRVTRVSWDLQEAFAQARPPTQSKGRTVMVRKDIWGASGA